MPDYTFTIETNPDSQDIALLKQKAGVKHINAQIPLGIFVRDPENQVIGGIYGWIADGWLYVDTLWLHESLRGQDYGTRLLRAMEQAAVQQGIDRCYLMTLGFQARPFYEKQGYTVFFTQEDFLAGHAVYGLRKTGLSRDGMQPDSAFRVDDPPDHIDVMALDDGLIAFNDRVIGKVPYGALAVLMRDANGSLIGGVFGDWFACSYNIDHGWVSHPDYWPPLLEHLEQAVAGEAGKRVFLRLLGDELLPVFQTAGHVISGTFEDFPVGGITYYLVKTV